MIFGRRPRTRSVSQSAPFRLSDGVLIAAATAFGYLVPYTYEYAFLTQMKMPIELIRVGTGDVLYASLSLLAAVAIILPAVDFCVETIVGRIFSSVGDNLRNLISNLLAFALFGWIALRLVRATWHGWSVFGIALIVLAILHFGEEMPYRPFLVLTALRNVLGRNALWILGWLIFALCVIYMWGTYQAQTRDVFAVVGPNRDLVVLRIYGDYVICAPLNSKEHTFQQDLRVLNLTDPQAHLMYARVGPLSPVEAPNAVAMSATQPSKH